MVSLLHWEIHCMSNKIGKSEKGKEKVVPPNLPRWR